MHDIKVGDMVRVVKAAYGVTEGKHYEVLGITPTGLVIETDQGTHGAYYPERFELVSKKGQAMFEVNERVRCISGDGQAYLTVGECYTIRAIDQDGDLHIVNNAGRTHFYSSSMFEPVVKVVSDKPDLLAITRDFLKGGGVPEKSDGDV